MLALVLVHAVGSAAAPVLVRRWGRRAFPVLALVPLAAFAWTAGRTGAVLDGRTVTQHVTWVPTLDLELTFAMSTLQWLLALVVSGVGALVLFYCTWYFADEEPGLVSFAGNFLGFAGSMLGLVLSDNLLLVYVFWELTTVFSYLLIGFDPTRRASRHAALQALMVTTFGGLAMLVGIVLIGTTAGTYRVTALLADPPTGAPITVAVLLLLLGAISKSAVFPFHFWLPSAMAAPTPVSAYLHAAAMVKAGVYLVALLAPGFAGVPGWRPLLLTLGVATMLLGAWRALRQFDLKLLLAYGTVSQLGFLITLVSIGTRDAALAGLAMLLAHALFKAALFLVVGIIDHGAGTRDLRRLSGLNRSAPVLFATAVLAGASMAGVPPVAGFVAKEGVYGALVHVADHGEGTGLAGWAGWTLLIGLATGSALTMAYTLRFLWGAFARKPGVPDTNPHRVPFGFAAAPGVLAVLCLLLGFLGPTETRLLRPYATGFRGASLEGLALWHGPNLALLVSVLALLSGLAVHRWRSRFAAVQAAFGAGWSAEGGYLATVRRLDRAAVEVTGLLQRGSAPAYLSVILAVVVLLPGAALLRNGWSPDHLVAWDLPAQALMGAVIALAAVLTVRARRRLKAVVMVGVTGYGTATLFLLHGAPDLALTQTLVETVSLVVFVLALRRLPEYFTDRPFTRWRYWQITIGALTAAAVAGIMFAATGARTATPVSTGFPGPVRSFGGGDNIVNVTLVDVRAWDTMGEIAVLVAAATGVASLIFIRRSRVVISRVRDLPPAEARPRAVRTVWLRGGRTLPPERRSVIFEVVTRLVFHTIVVFSVYLLFAGHNHPGGGFAAGLVTGLALMVRYLAGGRYELDEAAPIDAGVLLGAGLFVATGSGLLPLAFGGAVLQSAILDLQVPLMGRVHLVTSVFFDIGVYLVVVGLMLDLLRSFGAGIDRQVVAEQREAAGAR
ncbi:MAG TPA: Na+/H+ antiporter subunit A [Marmoricola sp.]|nr:Na+/H+ antiporter subunit A [Marmoricola sp.]